MKTLLVPISTPTTVTLISRVAPAVTSVSTWFIIPTVVIAPITIAVTASVVLIIGSTTRIIT